jgi:hypothetical protein
MIVDHTTDAVSVVRVPNVVSDRVPAAQTAVVIAAAVGTAVVIDAFIVAVKSPTVGALVRFVTVVVVVTVPTVVPLRATVAVGFVIKL